jgi:hypothetical protein
MATMRALTPSNFTRFVLVVIERWRFVDAELFVIFWVFRPCCRSLRTACVQEQIWGIQLPYLMALLCISAWDACKVAHAETQW